MTIFDWINQILVKKTHWNKFTEDEQKKFSPFIINRWLSMDKDFIEIVQTYEWVFINNFHICSDDHIDKIRRVMPIKLNDMKPIAETILHVRQLDRPLVSVNTYIDIIVDKDGLEPWIIIGDDMKTLQNIIDSSESFVNHSPYNNDSVREWFMLCKSRLVVGGFSSYVLSAALLNPGLEYKMIKKGKCNEEHLTGYDWKCLDLFVELFDNINWIDYD